MEGEVRVRYAPSPTGEPHVGNLRTALFNWLFARSNGGKFIVRVEDTDQDRYVQGALEAILDSLRWLGLDWDEGPGVAGPYGPYYQSERLQLYQDASRRLLGDGFAYKCYCSRERLEQMRLKQKRGRRLPGYDRLCRDLTLAQCDEHEAQGLVPVVRFKMPLEGETRFRDLIRGDVVWVNALLDDFILLKSDGYPTYHLANVVDDHMMKISHVLRAEEWLPSTPRHLELYSTLGYEPPRFAHLPMILGPDRAKLSKRHGATSVLKYRDEGFLPEAMVNFMVLLGWSLDDKTDVMPREVVVENFSIKRIGKAGAIFDKEKLLWMNGVYIRQLSEGDLIERMSPFLPGKNGQVDEEHLKRVVPLIQVRLKTLGEVAQLGYFFTEKIRNDPQLLVQEGMDAGSTRNALRRALDVLSPLTDFSTPAIEETLRSTAKELGLSGKQFFGLLRVATTGKSAAPPLFETMEVLGARRSLLRIESAARTLEKLDGPAQKGGRRRSRTDADR